MSPDPRFFMMNNLKGQCHEIIQGKKIGGRREAEVEEEEKENGMKERGKGREREQGRGGGEV